MVLRDHGLARGAPSVVVNQFFYRNIIIFGNSFGNMKLTEEGIRNGPEGIAKN